MSARFFLYRRNGTYYFRWTIPVALQRLMRPVDPAEVRLSLRTTQFQLARRRAAECWLAALDESAALVAKNSLISYKQLLSTLKGSGQMPATPISPTDDEEFLSLAELTATVDVARLQDMLAALQDAGAEFRIPVGPIEISVFRTAYDQDGDPYSEIVEVQDHFTDSAALLTQSSITAALASDKNLFLMRELHSDQTGMWEGSKDKKRYYEVVLPHPLDCNISSIKVAKRWTVGLRTSTPTSLSVASPPQPQADCEPIELSKALAAWAQENDRKNGGGWSPSTLTSYVATVKQFIEIVGDQRTTDLKPDDFKSFEDLMTKLPKDWDKLRRTSGQSLAQISLGSGARISAKTLKDKSAALRQFFKYLQAGGYWHGRFGYALFKTRKLVERKVEREVFTDDQLREIFSGRGVAMFAKAKHSLFLWGSILLLYTAARPGEIGQLKRQDVLQDTKGTWYLKIQESFEEEDGEEHSQHVKTSSSNRSVPLHPIVIQLGFLNFISKFSPSDWLFPKAQRPDDKWGAEIGKFWNERLLVSVGLKKPGRVLPRFCGHFH